VSTPSAAASTESRDTESWLRLIVVVLTQIQASFTVNALTVSTGRMPSRLLTDPRPGEEEEAAAAEPPSTRTVA
jgi:hypothetical protein